MIVIADTTPLNHLILIDQVPILEALYQRVIVPSAVLTELQAGGAPPKVVAWVGRRPDWLEVDFTAFPPEPGLAHLDDGERNAISLAQKLGADLVLMDDLGGRREALRRNLKIAGTLTVLYLAAERGLLQDFSATLQQQLQTGFRASPEIVQLFLDRYARRQKPPSSA
jgi:predicted nucleic acid-binding protein